MSSNDEPQRASDDSDASRSVSPVTTDTSEVTSSDGSRSVSPDVDVAPFINTLVEDAPENITVIAVDDSEDSYNMLETYVKRIHKPGFKVFLFHGQRMSVSDGREVHLVEDIFRYCAYAKSAEPDRQIPKRVQKMATKYLSYLQKHHVDCRFHTRLVPFKLGWAIVEEASLVDATLVLMGVNQCAGETRYRLGSISGYVLKHVHCHVCFHRMCDCKEKRAVEA